MNSELYLPGVFLEVFFDGIRLSLDERFVPGLSLPPDLPHRVGAGNAHVHELVVGQSAVRGTAVVDDRQSNAGERNVQFVLDSLVFPLAISKQS